MTRRTGLIVLVVSLVLLVALGSMTAFRRAAQISEPSTTSPIAVQQAYWEARIRAVGGPVAYQELSTSIVNLSVPLQHAEAHIFGGALYEVEGLPGFAVCDTQFNYGCYHEFFGRAIASLGLSVVNQLNQVCVDAPGSITLECQHGIGHGIVAYLGYSYDDLNKALGICAGLPSEENPLIGCEGGVFMEYDVQTMLDEGALPRAPTGRDMFFPCDSVATPFKDSCVFWQSWWWELELLKQDKHADEGNIFQKMGSLCSQLSSAELVEACFEGLGNFAYPAADMNEPRATALCDFASSDPASQVYCRLQLAKSIQKDFPNSEEKISVCAGLSGVADQHCTSYVMQQSNLPPQLQP